MPPKPPPWKRPRPDVPQMDGIPDPIGASTKQAGPDERHGEDRDPPARRRHSTDQGTPALHVYQLSQNDTLAVEIGAATPGR